MSEDIKDFLTTLEEYANGFDNIIAPHEDTIKDFLSYFNELQQENKQLKEDLRISKSNEETYCLEMQEITKILGLDEDTLFDDVKDYAKQLKEQLENKIDLYEDTISYQLGFDKGKEYLQQRIDKAIEHIKKYQYWNGDNYNCLHCEKLLEILGDKE